MSIRELKAKATRTNDAERVKLAETAEAEICPKAPVNDVADGLTDAAAAALTGSWEGKSEPIAMFPGLEGEAIHKLKLTFGSGSGDFQLEHPELYPAFGLHKQKDLVML